MLAESGFGLVSRLIRTVRSPSLTWELVSRLLRTVRIPSWVLEVGRDTDLHGEKSKCGLRAVLSAITVTRDSTSGIPRQVSLSPCR